MDGSTTTALRFTGLAPLEERELKDSVPSHDFEAQAQRPEGRPGTAYEPFTVAAIVVVSAAAIKGIATWALKRRDHKVIETEVEEVRADGSSHRARIRIEMTSSTTDADVIKALESQLSVDPSIMQAALELASS